jgi:hypothetical protein
MVRGAIFGVHEDRYPSKEISSLCKKFVVCRNITSVACFLHCLNLLRNTISSSKLRTIVFNFSFLSVICTSVDSYLVTESCQT